MTHSHHHHAHGPMTKPEAAARPLALSLMARSAAFRVLAVLGVLVLLWLAIAWAANLA